MSQSVLMIDAEQPFADNVANALRGRGLDVTVVGDGKEGLEKARGASHPAVIVLCVELPKMSGYSICNKLKKDDELKDIPLIITSSEATPETFEQHKKLKTRADGYLIKPFDAGALFDQMKALVPLEEGSEEVIDLSGDELEADVVADGKSEDGFDLSNLASEVVGGEELASLETEDDDLSLDDELGLQDEPLNLEDGAGDALQSFDDNFDALTEEPGEAVDAAASKVDDMDLDALLEEEPAAVQEEPLALDEIEALEPEPEPAPAPKVEPKPAPKAEPKPAAKPAPKAAAPSATATAAASAAANAASAELEKQLRELRRENGEQQARVAELEARLKAAEDEARKKASDLSQVQTSTSSSQRELLNLKQQLHEKEKELFKLKEEAFGKEKAVFEAEDKLAELQRQVDEAHAKLGDRDATVSSLNSRVSSLTEERNALESELQGRIAALEAQLATLAAERDQQVRELEQDRDAKVEEANNDRDAKVAEATRDRDSKVAAANRDRDTKVAAIEKERDTAKSRLEAVEKVAGERADRIDTLTSELASKEEQIGELYRKTKSDAEIRERARKAVEIAQALLSGSLGVDEAGDDGLTARQ